MRPLLINIYPSSLVNKKDFFNMLNRVVKKHRQPAISPATFSVALTTVRQLKKKKIEGKKKGFESTETKNEVPHIVE